MQGQEFQYVDSAAGGISYVVTTAEGTEGKYSVDVGYQASNIAELEKIRTIVNARF